MNVNSEYDVVVIGGGIHGVGVAQIYALNGYSVLLVEQFTLGSQTSSRSSKLIHGGLRYLESMQFSLVRECLTERKQLLSIAPELVRLVPFYIPVYRFNSRPPWLIRTGLSLYAMLGSFTKSARFRQLDTREWTELDGITGNNLRAVYQYYDAQTDDLALTRAVARSATCHGCHCLEQVRLISALRDRAAWHCVLRSGTESQEVKARVLINTAGPWVNQVQRVISPDMPRMNIEWVSGTHIEIDVPASENIYYVESPTDQRAVFVMPWRGHTMVGTTEARYHGAPNEVMPSQAECDYLKSVYEYYFSHTNAEIINRFAGVRVLPRDTNNPFNKPRETRLMRYPEQKPDYVAIYGGKLTSYRLTALKVFKLTRGALGFSGDFINSSSETLRPE